MATYVEFREGTGACCRTKPCSLRYQQLIKKYKQREVDPSITQTIVEALNELPADEREQVLEEIHGVADYENEDPSLVEICLDELEEEIKRSGRPLKVAYDLAISKDSQYVHNRDFRLKFLRADDFDVQRAAKKILIHFDLKLHLFGEQKLVKDIVFDDLSMDDKTSLCAGSHQLFGVKDAKGRCVFFVFHQLVEAASWENFFRMQFYQFMLASDDESVQRLGYVSVSIGSHKRKTLEMLKKAKCMIFDAMPLKSAAFHCCYINERVPLQFRLVLQMLNTMVHIRTRLHQYETTVALLYNLQSFGIIPNTVPLDNDGKPLTKLFLERLEERTMWERKSQKAAFTSNNAFVDVLDSDNTETSTTSNNFMLNDMDVLLGRGLKHVGNVVLDRIIDSEVVSYKYSSSKFEKSCIVLSTINRVRKSGGRFMKHDAQSSCEWVVADADEVRRSISSRFKKRSRKIK